MSASKWIPSPLANANSMNTAQLGTRELNDVNCHGNAQLSCTGKRANVALTFEASGPRPPPMPIICACIIFCVSSPAANHQRPCYGFSSFINSRVPKCFRLKPASSLDCRIPQPLNSKVKWGMLNFAMQL